MGKSAKHQGLPLTKAIDDLTGEWIDIKHATDKHKGHLVCPSPTCSRKVYAVKNVSHKIQHYSHNPDSSGGSDACRNPVGATESEIHHLAKEFVIKRKNIFLFPYLHSFERYKGRHISPIKLSSFPDQGFKAKLDIVESEVRYIADDYQPDITAIFNNEPFIIEVYYSHKVDDLKLQKIRRDDVAAIEISFSHLKTGYTWGDIKQAFLNPRRFRWLHYPQRWLSEEEIKRIDDYRNKAQKRIDQEILEYQEIQRQTELARQQYEEEAARSRVESEARRHVPYLADYLTEYIEFKLKDLKVTPFNAHERNLIGKCRLSIMEVLPILSQLNTSAPSTFYHLPNKEQFNKLIGEYRDSYRCALSREILQEIGEAWLLRHTIELHILGWNYHPELERIYDFKSRVISPKSGMEDCGEYITGVLLPASDHLVNRHLPRLHRLNN